MIIMICRYQAYLFIRQAFQCLVHNTVNYLGTFIRQVNECLVHKMCTRHVYQAFSTFLIIVPDFRFHSRRAHPCRHVYLAGKGSQQSEPHDMFLKKKSKGKGRPQTTLNWSAGMSLVQPRMSMIFSLLQVSILGVTMVCPNSFSSAVTLYTS